MRQSYVIANWKQNGSLSLIDEMVTGLGTQTFNTGIVMCPPAPFLPALHDALHSKGVAFETIAMGAQNCSREAQGAFTGEIGADMLAAVGCEFVLVGHSERRTLFAESDDEVVAKAISAQSAGLKPVVCVGETLAQREAGETMQVVERQIAALLQQVDLNKLLIAYEPVWAIGTGKTASPEEAQEVHAHLRRLVAQVDEAAALRIPLLYGGSVKADNADILFAQADIDGGLIGGASLKVDEFRAICSAVKG
jgi:triosephosphate isomerase (TIM)